MGQNNRVMWMYLAELHPTRISKVEVWRVNKKYIWVLDKEFLSTMGCQTLKEYQIETGKMYPPLKKIKKMKVNSAYFQGEEDAKKWIIQKLQSLIDKEAKILASLKRQKNKISKMSCKRLLSSRGM